MLMICERRKIICLSVGDLSDEIWIYMIISSPIWGYSMNDILVSGNMNIYGGFVFVWSRFLVGGGGVVGFL